jgi:hypothetical protein
MTKTGEIKRPDSPLAGERGEYIEYYVNLRKS